MGRPGRRPLQQPRSKRQWFDHPTKCPDASRVGSAHGEPSEPRGRGRSDVRVPSASDGGCERCQAETCRLSVAGSSPLTTLQLSAWVIGARERQVVLEDARRQAQEEQRSAVRRHGVGVRPRKLAPLPPHHRRHDQGGGSESASRRATQGRRPPHSRAPTTTRGSETFTTQARSQYR